LVHETAGDNGVFLLTAGIALAWLVVVATMERPSYLTTRLMAIPNAQAASAESIAAKLRQLPGVADAVVVAEEKLAYLKVDSRIFDAAALDRLAGAA
jgi:hypothetical protein